MLGNEIKNISVIRLKSKIAENYNQLLVILYFGAIIFLGARQFIWLDEGCTLITTSEGLIRAIKYSITFERQPPLYFALLNLWRSISDSIFWARLFSIVFIALSLLPISQLSKRVFGKKSYYFIWLFLLNPFTILAALEIRYISLIIFLAAYIEYLFIRVYIDKQSKYRFLFIFISILGIYTQYFTALLLVANFLVLAVKKNKSVYRYLIDMIFPVLSVLVFIPFLNNQVTSNTVGNARLSVLYLIEFNLVRLKNIVLDTYNIKSVSLIYEIIFGLIILLSVFSKKPISFLRNLVQDNFFIKLVFLLILFSVLIIPIDKSIIQVRHMVALYVPILMVFYMILNNCSPLLKRIFFFTITIIYLLIQFSERSQRIKGQEYSKIAEFIEISESSNQPIFVYRNDLSIPLQFLYKGTNSIFQIPVEIDFENSTEMENKAIKNKDELSQLFNNANLNDTIWLVTTNNGILFNIDFKDELLEEFIQENFTTLEVDSFKEIKVRKLVKQEY